MFDVCLQDCTTLCPVGVCVQMTINLPVPPAMHLLQQLLERAQERHRERQANGESSSSSSNEDNDNEGAVHEAEGGAKKTTNKKKKCKLITLSP